MRCPPAPPRRVQRILRAAGAIIAAEALIAITIVALTLPGLLAQRQDFTITFGVISSPATLEFPITKERSSGDPLTALRCEKSPSTEKEIQFSLNCSYVAESLYDGQKFLENLGLELTNYYRNVSSKSAPGNLDPLIWQVLLGLLAWYGWLRLTKTRLRNDIGNGISFVKKKPLHLLLPYALSMLALTLSAQFFPETPAPSRAELGLDYLPHALATAVLIAPIVEEAIFRGLVYDILAKHIHWAISAFICTASFTLIHFVPSDAAWTGHLSIFIMGAGLLWLRAKSSSLTLCVFAHALYNALVLAAMFFTKG